MNSDRIEKDHPALLLNGDKLNLLVLFETLRRGKKIIIVITFAAILLGLLIALLIPNRYMASATILPHGESKTELGQLGNLASLAGVNISSMLDDAAHVPPELYEHIISSLPFLRDLVNTEFTFEEEDERISLFEKMYADTLLTFTDQLIKYSVRLPWTLKNTISGSEESGGAVLEDLNGMVKMNKRALRILENVHSWITVDVSTSSGLVSIQVEAEEPLLAAELTKTTVDLLQQSIIQYRTKQVRANHDFVKARYAEKKEEYASAQKVLFDYLDAHRNVVAERMDMKHQQLQDRYELSMRLYHSLAEQYEQAGINLKKDTPAFSVIDPVIIPVEKFYPRLSIFMLIFAVLGVFIGLSIVIGKEVVKSIKYSWSLRK